MDRWFVQSPSEFANTFHVLFTRWIPLKELGSIPSGVPGYCMVIKNRKAREPVSSRQLSPQHIILLQFCGDFSCNCSSSYYFYHWRGSFICEVSECAAVRADSCTCLQNDWYLRAASCLSLRDRPRASVDGRRKKKIFQPVGSAPRRLDWAATQKPVHSQTHNVIASIAGGQVAPSFCSRTNFLAHWLLLKETCGSRYEGLPVATATMSPIKS